MSRFKLRVLFFLTAAVLFILNALFTTYLGSGVKLIVQHFLLIVVSFFTLYMIIQDSIVDKERPPVTKEKLAQFSALVAKKLSQKGKPEGEKYTFHEVVNAVQEAVSDLEKENS